MGIGQDNQRIEIKISMANTLHINHDFELEARHQANIVASLSRRLAIAKATNNLSLVELLEQERRQIILETTRARITKLNGLAALVDRFDRFCQGFVKAIFHPEVRIWQTTDGVGGVYWNAYDPQSGQTITTDSEAELRVWIEQNCQEI